MSKSKSTKKKASKPRATKGQAKKAPRENLCVFALRLKPEERTAIHKAAGPGKASRFARSILVAAARNDEAAVKEIMKATQSQA